MFYCIADHKSLKTKTKNSFQDRLSLNASQKYCRMLQESTLQYVQPSLSNICLLDIRFVYFLSGGLRQVLLYISISVTNPLDVIKIRMQLEKEMVAQKGLSHMKGRYYNGLIKGCAKVIQDEGIRGLYKG